MDFCLSRLCFSVCCIVSICDHVTPNPSFPYYNNTSLHSIRTQRINWQSFSASFVVTEKRKQQRRRDIHFFESQSRSLLRSQTESGIHLGLSFLSGLREHFRAFEYALSRMQPLSVRLLPSRGSTVQPTHIFTYLTTFDDLL